LPAATLTGRRLLIFSLTTPKRQTGANPSQDTATGLGLLLLLATGLPAGRRTTTTRTLLARRLARALLLAALPTSKWQTRANTSQEATTLLLLLAALRLAAFRLVSGRVILSAAKWIQAG
jgi:hypothetical protein